MPVLTPERRAEMNAYILEHPTELDRVVADLFGVTRQRVHQRRQILGVGHLSSENVTRVCPDCGDRKTFAWEDRQPKAKAQGTAPGGEFTQRCRPCAVAHWKPPTQPVTTRCDGCGNDYTLRDDAARRWRQNRRMWPELRSFCPDCVALGKAWWLPGKPGAEQTRAVRQAMLAQERKQEQHEVVFR